jgi:hypothetical protein
MMMNVFDKDKVLAPAKKFLTGVDKSFVDVGDLEFRTFISHPKRTEGNTL